MTADGSAAGTAPPARVDWRLWLAVFGLLLFAGTVLLVRGLAHG